ncbi:MAG: hypothetical protein KatS3mg114_1144 [Planctomycetaceae bacterium]|nr:MAG: hypothetical protein KatS3mg114_1144 [Planctomycetaceae bacterium]
MFVSRDWSRKKDVEAVLASVDACLVHLRGTELFETVIPSKVFEMLAMQVPIIMGVRGQAQQIVLEAEGGIPMTPDDPHSLLEALERLAQEPQRYRGGRQYVQQHYNRDRLAAEMLQVLVQHAVPTARSRAEPPTAAHGHPTRRAA